MSLSFSSTFDSLVVDVIELSSTLTLIFSSTDFFIFLPGSSSDDSISPTSSIIQSWEYCKPCLLSPILASVSCSVCLFVICDSLVSFDSLSSSEDISSIVSID